MINPNIKTQLKQQADSYIDVLGDWLLGLEPLSLASLEPQKTAVACVDVIEGFHRVGPLASPRVATIIPNVVNLLESLSNAGVPSGNMVFIQDAHPENAQEFDAYPPHCVIGTEEAEAVVELKDLSMWHDCVHVTKNSIASHTSPEFNAWLAQLSPEVDTIIAIGDVTDLCLYTLALHLQVRNLAEGLQQRIVVPENCVQTWDAPDHPGDLYHALFLHQMSRNGIEIVKTIS